MQTMPQKNRMSTLVTGIALLVVVVGLIAYGVNQRSKNEMSEVDPLTEVAAPENGNAMQPGTQVDAASTTPDVAMTGTTEAAAPATGTLESDMAEAAAQLEATPALTTLGAVPETHVVEPNETLSSISRLYYGDEVFAGDIESLNGIQDPNKIMVGQELKLPRPEALMTTVGE